MLFGWSVTLADISASLSANAQYNHTHIHVYGLHTTTTGVFMLGQTEINIGDSVQVEGGATNKIAELRASDRRIRLDGQVRDNDDVPVYPGGTPVILTPRNGALYSNSVDGIATTVGAVTITVNSFTLTVDSTAQFAPGMLLYRDSAYIVVERVMSATTARCSSGPSSTLGTGRGATSTWPSGTTLSGAIVVIDSGRTQAIGGTGVSIAMSSTSWDVGDSALFMTGDKIIITCEGFISRKVKHTITRSVDDVSIDRYGKKEWKPPRENKLMTPARSRIHMEIMSSWADPHWVVKATGCPMMIAPEVGDLYTVEHSWLFVGETSNQVLCEITGITRNLDSGLMDLSLRSVGAATRGKGADPSTELRAPARWKRWRASRWRLGRF